MLQTVAIMGPPRFGVPLTQALTAPLLGTLEARGTSVRTQVLACGAIRLLQNALFVAFFIVVLAGGVDAYTNTWDSLTSKVGLPEGTAAALIATAAGLLLWAVFASIVQVLVYRRGLFRWADQPTRERHAASAAPTHVVRRFDPRAVALAAAVVFTLLVASTSWPLLGAVAAWLALAWAVSRPDLDVVPAGAVLALSLALGVLTFSLLGGAGADLALRRASRAMLLVIAATWLRAAAGLSGLREVSRRALLKLRRLPAAPEASLVMEQLGGGRELGPAARSAFASLRSVRMRPLPVLDAVLRWVAAESMRFRPAPRADPPALTVGLDDILLVAFAAACALALGAG
jgi:hypothetical protein